MKPLFYYYTLLTPLSYSYNLLYKVLLGESKGVYLHASHIGGSDLDITLKSHRHPLIISLRVDDKQITLLR